MLSVILTTTYIVCSLSPGGIAGGMGQAYQYEYQKQFLKGIKNQKYILLADTFLDLMQIPSEIKGVWLVDENSKVRAYKKPKNTTGEVLLTHNWNCFMESINESYKSC